MGRERKATIGASNRPSSAPPISISHFNVTRNNGGIANKQKENFENFEEKQMNDFNQSRQLSTKEFHKSSTHNLITPSASNSSINLNMSKDINVYSTWGQKKVDKILYTSIARGEYLDPATINIPPCSFEINKDDFKSKKTKDNEEKAIKKFANISKNSYGNAQNMSNKLFHKDTVDTLTPNELKLSMLQKYKHITDKDIKLLFQAINIGNYPNNEIPISEVVKVLDNYNFIDEAKSNIENSEIRNFISKKINEERKETKLNFDINKSLIIDVEVGDTEMNNMLNKNINNKLNNEREKKYIRFLQRSNLKLDNVPFFDNRSEDLNRLHNASNNLKKESAEKYESLIQAKIRKEISENEVKKYQVPDISMVTSQEITSNYNSFDNRRKQRPFTASVIKSKSMGNLTGGESYSHGDDVNLNKKPIPRNVAGDVSNVNFTNPDENVELSPSKLRNRPQISSNISNKTKKISNNNSNIDMNESISADFYPQIVDQLKMVKMVNPGAILFVPTKQLEPESNAGQKKPSRYNSHDNDASLFKSTNYTEKDSRMQYQTQSLESYPKFIFEQNKEPRRDNIGDADRISNEKEARRNARFARQLSNSNITKDRIEYEILNRELKEINRQNSTIENRLRYNTTVLCDDLRQLKKVPLECVALKPNIKLSDRMWAGSQKTVGDGLKTDFTTTYQSTYNAEALHKFEKTNSNLFFKVN